jgi:membrane protein implicated in regulation of membrane protease activity
VSALVWDPLVWLALALLLMAAEALAAGFFLLGFGVGAALVAGVLVVAAERVQAAPEPVSALVTIWAGASLAAWLVLWLLFGRRSQRSGGDDVNDFRNHG